MFKVIGEVDMKKHMDCDEFVPWDIEQYGVFPYYNDAFFMKDVVTVNVLRSSPKRILVAVSELVLFYAHLKTPQTYMDKGENPKYNAGFIFSPRSDVWAFFRIVLAKWFSRSYLPFSSLKRFAPRHCTEDSVLITGSSFDSIPLMGVKGDSDSFIQRSINPVTKQPDIRDPNYGPYNALVDSKFNTGDLVTAVLEFYLTSDAIRCDIHCITHLRKGYLGKLVDAGVKDHDYTSNKDASVLALKNTLEIPKVHAFEIPTQDFSEAVNVPKILPDSSIKDDYVGFSNLEREDITSPTISKALDKEDVLDTVLSNPNDR